MNELEQKIVGLLKNAGGKIPYPELLAAMDAFERQSLSRTLVAMAAKKLVHQTVTWDGDAIANRHDVNAGARPKPDDHSL